MKFTEFRNQLFEALVVFIFDFCNDIVFTLNKKNLLG